MTSSSEILVLIADETNATLCANIDGITRLLRSIDRVQPVNDGPDDGEDALHDRHDFACELMMALCRDTGKHRYDGVIIFAAAPMMDALRRVQTSTISRLMIAHIVGVPSDNIHCPDFSPANMQPAHLAVLH